MRMKRKRTCLEFKEGIQASMVEERPQHQPFAHLDVAGAKDDPQPPQHQHEVDGWEAGERRMDAKRFINVRKRYRVSQNTVFTLF